MYIAIFAPTTEEAIALHHAADRVYRWNVNGYGVKVTAWNRDKVEFYFEVGGLYPITCARELCYSIAREYHHLLPDSDAELSWGSEPQEPEEDLTWEDYKEWVAASCGEC